MFKRPILLLMLVAVLLSIGAFAVSATKVTNGPLNVRADATTNSSNLGTLETGTEVTILETKAVGDYTWGRFLYKGSSAWIRLDYTDFDTAQVKRTTVISGPLNVRAQATTDSSVVGSLEEGVSVTVLETKTQGNYTWGRITLAGDTVGWIRLDYTDYSGGAVTPPPAVDPEPTVRREWSKKDGKWYYYIDGVMQTGWQLDNGKWYFMNGAGVMQTGWLYISNVWYYFNSNGAMVTGWQKISGVLYYFNEDGKMLTGWQEIASRWYYFNTEGAACIGWQDINGSRYYFDSTGAMATGKYRVDGVGYLFNDKGVLQGEAQFTSSDCLAVLKLEEGFSATPYWDYTQWTVGYGTVCPDDKLEQYRTYGISEKEAEELLRNYLDTVEKDVDSFAARYGLTFTQGQYDALVLFSYNVGSGWIWETNGVFHNAIKNGATGNELIRAFSIWNSAGGSFKDFLMRRRLSEANMYLNSAYSMEPPANYCYVRYDANGGDVSPKAQGYDSNVPVKPMSVPTNGAKKFLGWYTAKTGGTKVEELNASHKGMMLCAHWETQGTDTKADRPIIVTVNTADVSLRKGPGTEHARLDNKPYAQTGEKYTILETYQGDTLLWGRFTELGGGWICLSYTDYTEALKAQSASNDWVQLDGNWYYYKGLYKHIGWLKLEDTWYYMDAKGVLQTGWVVLGNTWYYMRSDGAMVTGIVTIDGKKHEFHTSGAWLGEVTQNGWVLENGTWYYYKSGVKHTGWLQLGNTQYYLKPDGAMATGTVVIDGKTHSFHTSGAWLGEVSLTGWVQEGATWYYYKSGVKQTGWLQLNGVWYYLQPSGAMKTGWLQLNGVWYYLQPSGAMKTGWLKLGDDWFYLDSNGAMVTGKKLIGPVTYYFDENGYWIP